MRDILVGIDPSFATMGAAIYYPDTKVLKLKTGDFGSVINWLNVSVKFSRVILVVENPALNSTTFKMWPMMKSEIEQLSAYEQWRVKKSIGNMPGVKKIEELQSVFAIAMNYAQKVGENKAAAKYFLNLIGNTVPTVEIAPSGRDRYDKMKAKLGKKAKINLDTLKFPTKTNQTVFNEWTGYEGRSSEHARDAATLVYGRTIRWALGMLPTKKVPSSYPSGRNDNFFLAKRKSK